MKCCPSCGVDMTGMLSDICSPCLKRGEGDGFDDLFNGIPVVQSDLVPPGELWMIDTEKAKAVPFMVIGNLRISDNTPPPGINVGTFVQTPGHLANGRWPGCEICGMSLFWDHVDDLYWCPEETCKLYRESLPGAGVRLVKPVCEQSTTQWAAKYKWCVMFAHAPWALLMYAVYLRSARASAILNGIDMNSIRDRVLKRFGFNIPPGF